MAPGIIKAFGMDEAGPEQLGRAGLYHRSAARRHADAAGRECREFAAKCILPGAELVIGPRCGRPRSSSMNATTKAKLPASRDLQGRAWR